jgi:3-oxoadipate enol-lactonase
MQAMINGVQLAYSERGVRRETALLLIHGFPLNRHLWASQLVGLSTELRVIAPDLRGQGDSDTPPGPYTMDQHADDLAALLDHLGVGRVIVAGLSMGGYVAFAFWRRYAARVQALALFDTRAEPDSPAARANREQSIELVEQRGPEALAREMLGKLLAPANLENDTLAGRALAIMAMQRTPGIVGTLLGLRDRPDSRPTLPTIRVPTLVAVGEADALVPVEDARALAAGIPGAHLSVIPHAGHLTPLENPRAVNAALREFTHEFSL